MITHGLSTYSNNKCRCQVCRDAHSAYMRAYRERRKAAITALDPRHGTASFYTNAKCRCPRCRVAWADASSRKKRSREKAKE